MAARRSQLPPALVREYWGLVAEILQTRFDVSAAAARRGIVSYRRKVAEFRIGDILYHKSPAETAEGIVRGEYLDVPVGQVPPDESVPAS